jgi:hypothetical protein
MPELGTVGQRYYDELSAYAPDDEGYGWAWAYWLGGLGLLSEDLDEALREQEDGRDGLQALMDPQSAPEWALDWLRMLPGVTFPKDASPERKRQLLQQTPAKDRGSEKAIIGAARQYLSDPVAGHVFIEAPFEGSCWRILVVTAASETPDEEAVRRALDSGKVLAAGVRLTYRAAPLVIDALEGTIDELEGTIDALGSE